MKAPSITLLKKYLAFLEKTKDKYVTSEKLSLKFGVYPEVINETMSYFEPMVNMDPSFNLLDLVPAIKECLAELEENKTPVVRQTPISKRVINEYESVNDFVYQKMSIGGIVDQNAYLSDKDLRIMKKLCDIELKQRKNKK